MKVTIYADGASRGNPGPAAIGVVAVVEGEIVGRLSRAIGRATNNQAEYQAIIAGLEMAAELAAESVDIWVDSELVVKQINGEYRVKAARLKPLFHAVTDLGRRFSSFTIQWIGREENQRADALANEALN